MTTLTYERGNEFFLRVIKLDPAKVNILCPVCGSVLLFAPDHASAARLKMHPGIKCPVDRKHVCETFSFGR